MGDCMSLISNIMNQRTLENLRINQQRQVEAIKRLSSGKRINSSADDAAGLAVSTRMTVKSIGLDTASRNSSDGISLIETADSALNTMVNIFTRMRELALAANNGTVSKDDRALYNKEFQELKNGISNIAEKTNFNGINLFEPQYNSVTGEYEGKTISIQASDEAGDTIDIHLPNLQGDSFSIVEIVNDVSLVYARDVYNGNKPTSVVDWSGFPYPLSFDELTLEDGQGFYQYITENYMGENYDPPLYLGTQSTYSSYDPDALTNMKENGLPIDMVLQYIDKSIDNILSARADLGATNNRLEYNITNLNNQKINTDQANSRIMDADMAKEMSEFVKSKILTESGISMLNQGNEAKKMLIKLLEG